MTARPISQVSGSDPALSEREQRLELAIAEYLEAVRAGRPPDRADVLARHGDLEADLMSFFAGEDRLKGLAGSLLPRARSRRPRGRSSTEPARRAQAPISASTS